MSLTQGATAYWVTEGAAIPVSEQTFAETPLLRPKELAALVPISNKLLAAASETPAVEEVVRDHASADVGDDRAPQDLDRRVPGRDWPCRAPADRSPWGSATRPG